MCKKIFKYHLVMSKTIALIRHPSLLFSLYPEVKNHRSYSAPSLLFFCSQNVLHRSYSARFYISFIWHSGVSEMVDHLNSLFAPPFKRDTSENCAPPGPKNKNFCPPPFAKSELINRL